jgi:hypothetical protein
VRAVTPLIEAGKVYLPLNTSWTKTVTDECEDFPDGEFDDIVDSISQFLNYAKGKNTVSKEPITHVARRNILNKYRKYRTSPHPSPKQREGGKGFGLGTEGHFKKDWMVFVNFWVKYFSIQS